MSGKVIEIFEDKILKKSVLVNFPVYFIQDC